MQTDLHQSMRHLIDRSLAGELSSTEHHSLRDHLHDCAACQKYAEDSRRAIAAPRRIFLPGKPGPSGKSLRCSRRAGAATRSRAAQPSAYRAHLHHRLSAHHHRLLRRIAHGQSTRRCLSPGAREAQTGVLALWVLPSLCFSLFLPVVLLLSARSAKAKGSVL